MRQVVLLKNPCKEGACLARGSEEESSAFNAAHALRGGEWREHSTAEWFIGFLHTRSKVYHDWCQSGIVRYHIINTTQYSDIYSYTTNIIHSLNLPSRLVESCSPLLFRSRWLLLRILS